MKTLKSDKNLLCATDGMLSGRHKSFPCWVWRATTGCIKWRYSYRLFLLLEQGPPHTVWHHLHKSVEAWGDPGAGDREGLWHRPGMNMLSNANTEFFWIWPELWVRVSLKVEVPLVFGDWETVCMWATEDLNFELRSLQWQLDPISAWIPSLTLCELEHNFCE